MDARREHILKTIVDEYIRTAEPVGSKTLVERYGLDVSSATVRNEMVELERTGYIAAPHTSAGRVPTEKAFVYYLRNFVEGSEGANGSEGAKEMKKAVRDADNEQGAMRAVANTLSELTGEMTFVTIDSHSSHYAGVGKLLLKPEFFGDREVTKALAMMVDRFEAIVRDIFDDIPHKPQVMIGRDSPFGKDMTSMVVKFHLPDGHSAILCLVGPMRMDYGRNIALLEAAKELLDES